ncbi:hypothetical protein CEXT_739011 [Caerostris extrusa]|uniref:Uncharacterized protein n=1 Tax=Caerostris extrusa TaxID=172846 RepID=A0AAV4WBH7_CAEEX|nr:hypothetical protein CEXT_739011 [Caerostris extrusa]
MEDLKPVLEKFKLLDTSEQLAVLLNLAMPKPSEVAKVPSNLCEIAQTRSVNNCSRIKLPTEYRYDGNLNSFHLDPHQTTVEVTVTGPPVIIIGAIITFRPIPCYSSTHRSLSFELRIGNTTTNIKSSAKTEQKAEGDNEEQLERKVFLDEYVAISEGEKAELTVQVAAEGVRVMQCFNNTFSTQCGKTCIAFDFDTNSSNKLLFPIKEIMCMSG